MDSQAIQSFLIKHRVNERTCIPKDDLIELNEIFSKRARIHLNFSKANPLTAMETITIALATVFEIPEIASITMSSPNTVKSAFVRARLKLNAHTLRASISEAIRKGYIELIN